MAEVVVVGSFVQDLAFSTAVFPAPGETRIGYFQTGPGGKGFNQAVAANRQGVQSLYIGAVGRDMFAEQARAFADGEHLRCVFQIVDGEASGAASIVVNDAAENLIVVALGANDHLAISHIDRFTVDIEAARVLICQLECNLPATAHALALGRAAGVTTILNPAPINDGITRDMLDHVDILVPNETEFAFLCRHLFDQTLDDNYWMRPEAELHKLCAVLGVATVIITLGAKGCFVSHHGRALHPAALPYYRVAAADVNPVDSTGAGDAFCGGLAAGLARYGVGKLNMACQLATRVAGLSTEKPGTSPAMPTDQDLLGRFGDG